MKKFLSLLLVVVMVGCVLPATAFAASGATVANLQVTDATYYSSGALKSLSASFDWVQGEVQAHLALMTQKLNGTGVSGDWGDFSNMGNYSDDYASFEEVLADNSKFGIVASTGATTIPTNSTGNTMRFSFSENAIALNTNATYYVYLWALYGGQCYPDNLMFVIQVKDGAVKYTPATPDGGRNAYDESAFQGVVSQTTFDVAITAAEHMTKTEASGAATQEDLGVPMTPVVYTADRGYVFPEDYVSGIAITANSGITVTRNSAKQITISGMPVVDTTVALPALDADTEYNVTCATGLTGGTVSTSVSKAYDGDTITVTPSPAEGYELTSVSYSDGTNTVAITPVEGVYSFTMPAANVTVSAVYTIKSYTVTYKANDEVVGTPQTVEHGKNTVPETVPAKEGYTGSWSSDGKNITADTTITANYTINKYSVTYMADGVPVGEVQTVEHGGNATAPAVPAKTGYTGAWSSDGKNITGATTITANYTINTYEVKYMADGVQVGQTQTVTHGGNATAPEIPAKEGYMGQWSADGKNITANTTIEAVYTAIPVEAPAAEVPQTGDERQALLWGGMLLTMGAAAMLLGRKKYNN